VEITSRTLRSADCGYPPAMPCFPTRAILDPIQPLPTFIRPTSQYDSPFAILRFMNPFAIDSGGIFVTLMIEAIWPQYSHLKNSLSPSEGATSADFLSFFLFWCVLHPNHLSVPNALQASTATIRLHPPFEARLAFQRQGYRRPGLCNWHLGLGRLAQKHLQISADIVLVCT